MSYLIQASMTRDNYLIERVAACAATFGIPDARVWATRNLWALSGSEGWATAYAASAGEVDPTDPSYTPIAGADETAITDQMILDAVATLCTPAEPEPDPEPEEGDPTSD